MENNNITNKKIAGMIEDLAVMVKNGFDETGSRLERLEQGQTDIKARL
jgi:polyhydroxyalkanoate synthesis regulator phasin